MRDAAYESLLKSRRQELHRKIAGVIEERFPATADTEPELLAHHYSEARQFEKAIPLWHNAGRLALRRFALREAIAHLEKDLDLVSARPPSAERHRQEVDLRCLLGTTWFALRGWQAQEVWDSLHPALQLATSLRRNDALLPIFFGLWDNVLVRGRVAESLAWVKHIQGAAETYHDSGLRSLGHMTAVNSYFWFGEPIKAREHADQVLVQDEENRLRDLVGVLNHDPKTHSLTWAGLSTWAVGYPEQAITICHARDSLARRIGHPFDLGVTLTVGSMIFDFLREPEEALKRGQEAAGLGRDNNLVLLTEMLAPLHSGVALIRNGPVAGGIPSLKAGLAVWEESGARIRIPYAKSVLARALRNSAISIMR